MWASIVTGVIAFFKAIPGIVKIVQVILDFIEKRRDAKIQKHYEEKQRLREKLAKQLENAKTDEERANLVKLLNNMN